MAAAVAALEVNSLKGASGDYVFDARGWTEADSAPALLSPEGQITRGGMDAGDVARALSALTVPLPNEPVGVGARWRVTRPVGSSGTMMISTEYATEYTLRSRTGNRILVEFRASGLAADAPGAPPTEGKVGSTITKTTVNSDKVEESGRGIIDLDRLVPSTWLESSTQLEKTITSGDQPAQRTSASGRTRLSIAPAAE